MTGKLRCKLSEAEIFLTCCLFSLGNSVNLFHEICAIVRCFFTLLPFQVANSGLKSLLVAVRSSPKIDLFSFWSMVSLVSCQTWMKFFFRLLLADPALEWLSPICYFKRLLLLRQKGHIQCALDCVLNVINVLILLGVSWIIFRVPRYNTRL